MNPNSKAVLDTTADQNSTGKPSYERSSPSAEAPARANQGADDTEIFAARQRRIEDIVEEVFQQNKDYFVSLGESFRKDLTVMVMERLVPPQYRAHFNYKTIRTVLKFVCSFEIPDRSLRNLIQGGKLTLPKQLQEKTTRAEKLYHDYYSEKDSGGLGGSH